MNNRLVFETYFTKKKVCGNNNFDPYPKFLFFFLAGQRLIIKNA